MSIAEKSFGPEREVEGRQKPLTWDSPPSGIPFSPTPPVVHDGCPSSVSMEHPDIEGEDSADFDFEA